MSEDIMLDWSCEALAFQMSRPNFSFLRPIPSPPAHFPFFLSLRSEVATAARLSALVTEERRANMMRSDRVLFENPVQLGLRNSQVCLFFPPRVCGDFNRVRQRR